MLLGNKKTLLEDQEKSWCVVLGALENEIDRKRVAQKISDVFSLSTEEAGDLVRNTPIILLDHLTKAIAEKLKNYFSQFGADLILSKDTVFKRKCYRTVWPQPPSLAFLHSWEGDKGQAAEPQDREREREHEAEAQIPQAMNPTQALDEIRSMMNERIRKKEMKGLPSRLEIPVPSEPEKAPLPLFARKEEVSPVQISVPAPKAEVPVIQPELPRISHPSQEDLLAVQKNVASEIEVLRGEMERLQGAGQSWEVKLESARKSLEDSLMNSFKKQSELEQKLAELSVEMSEVHNQEKHMEIEARVRDQFGREILQREQELRSWTDKKSEGVLSEIERVYASLQALEKRLAAVETSQLTAAAASQSLGQGIQQIQQQISEFDQRWGTFVTHEDQEAKIRENMNHWSDLFRQEFEALEKKVRDHQAEKQAKPAEVEVWQNTVADLCTKVEKQQDVLEKILRYMVLRDAKPAVSSEGTQEKVRAGSQEASWNRAEHEKQLAARLADKEALLKRLVADQEQVEKEIHEREEQMKRILGDQEKVEKEIIEVRQAQRQFALFDRAR